MREQIQQLVNQFRSEAADMTDIQFWITASVLASAIIAGLWRYLSVGLIVGGFVWKRSRAKPGLVCQAVLDLVSSPVAEYDEKDDRVIADTLCIWFGRLVQGKGGREWEPHCISLRDVDLKEFMSRKEYKTIVQAAMDEKAKQIRAAFEEDKAEKIHHLKKALNTKKEMTAKEQLTKRFNDSICHGTIAPYMELGIPSGKGKASFQENEALNEWSGSNVAH